MTNSAKKMTKDQKETVYQIMAEKVCGYYGISDELEPTISVKGHSALGEYFERDAMWINGNKIVIDHHIVIRPSEGLDTLAHELAHFVQNITEGNTRCHDMNMAGTKGNNNMDLCDRHDTLMAEIRKIIDCDMAA